jgi:hypothetical protein
MIARRSSLPTMFARAAGQVQIVDRTDRPDRQYAFAIVPRAWPAALFPATDLVAAAARASND